jgi:predicted AAA+ superfamily ATPase
MLRNLSDWCIVQAEVSRVDKRKYRPRVIDKRIDKYLSAFGAVCVEGSKWCGKTWTSSFHSKSAIFLGDPAGNFQNRELARLAPAVALEGETPRLIDEWQEIPPLWDAVRHKVDQTAAKGQFILTGSATPNHKGILHSGAGRIARLRMRPMSLYESGDSSGQVSLEALCKGELTPVMTGEVDLRKLIALILRGGWPGSLELPADEAALLPAEYLDAIIDDDVYRIDGVKRDTQKMRLLLRSLARNESTAATNKTLKNDIKAVDDEDIDMETVAAYLDIFKRLFITDNQPPFSANIRSSVRVKQAEKRHFADPSLAAALLRATPAGLLSDLATLGFLFEALCERDLRIYAEAFGAQLYHYQDYRGREIDAVIELPDGRWRAFEIKLGASQIDEAAGKLRKLRDELAREERAVPPSALCVICGLSNAAYQREDGVYVAPLTALRD